MKENYDKKMTELLKDLPKGTPLLLHSCCAPCSSACLETLKEHFELTVFYYNPNIGDEAEYLKRKAEQIRFLKETGWAKLLDCDHDAAAFIGIARGLEEEPERGRRCYRCYKLRLDAAAEAAHRPAPIPVLILRIPRPQRPVLPGSPSRRDRTAAASRKSAPVIVADAAAAEAAAISPLRARRFDHHGKI